MRHHEDGADVHHRREADGRAAVVREAQEGAAVGDQAAMQGDAVHRRRHAVLPHAVMHVGAVVLARPDLDLALGLRVVRRRQVGRAAQHLRDGVEQVVEHGAAGLPGRQLLAAPDELARGRRRWPTSSRRAACPRCAARTPGAAPSGACPTRSAQAWRAARALGADGPPLARRCSGMTKGGESQPRILRAPAISSSPGASLCAFCVPALVGKPKPMIVRAGDHARACR